MVVEEGVERSSRVVVWHRALVKALSHLGLKVVPPTCFGHMHGMVRWITPSSTPEDLECNAGKVAACLNCKLEDACFKRSLASYSFQGIPREDMSLLEKLVESLGGGDDAGGP